MILTTGSPEALSFTDDTSLPNPGPKVSIHAQVVRELPLDWYFALLQRAPSHAGELKSKVIVEVFFTLPDFERRRVLSTLKTVRMHITDPRPYTHHVDELLADIVPGGDVPGFIKRLDKAPPPRGRGSNSSSGRRRCATPWTRPGSWPSTWPSFPAGRAFSSSWTALAASVGEMARRMPPPRGWPSGPMIRFPC